MPFELNPLQQKIRDSLKVYKGMPNNKETRNMMKNTIFRVLKNDEEFSENILILSIKLLNAEEKEVGE